RARLRCPGLRRGGAGVRHRQPRSVAAGRHRRRAELAMAGPRGPGAAACADCDRPERVPQRAVRCPAHPDGILASRRLMTTSEIEYSGLAAIYHKRFVAVHERLASPEALNVSLRLEIEGPLDFGALARAASALIRRHHALRTGF